MEIASPPKKMIAHSFSRSASRYCASAFIQRAILEQCVVLMRNSGLSGRAWLDAGCGADLLGEFLTEDITALKLFRTDLAYGSLKMINAQKSGTLFLVQSDIENLPFKNGKFDGVLVSSVLHWLDDLQKGLLEIVRVLKPDGRIVFAAFLRGSFHEVCILREKMGLTVPVHFPDDHELHDMVKICGLDLLDFSIKSEKHYFHSAWEILKYLSDIGSSAVSGKRLSRSSLLAFCRDYEERFGTKRGIPLSSCFACGIARRSSSRRDSP